MTILFRDDWLKHPGAVIDYGTQNKSFLKYAEVLHGMKVENCAWPLALHRKELVGVDPFSPDLTIEQKGMILSEAKENLWYYLREVIRIPVPGSLNPIKYGANRGNMAMYWSYMNHITTISTILRQTGKTTTLASIISWLKTVGSTNTLSAMLTKSDSLRTETLAKIKDIIEELPDYVNLADMKRDIFNSEEIRIAFNNNSFTASLSSSSPKNAEKVGRGITAPNIFIDEAAFIDNIEIAMGALLMAGNAARTFAAQLGKPYGTMLTTTAGNTNDRDAKYIYGLVEGAAVFRENYFDCKDLTELREMVYKNCLSTQNKVKTPMFNITMSYRQLGYDDVWLKQKLEENVSSPENIARDIFNSWSAGASKSPIPKVYLDQLNESIVEDPRIEIFAPYGFVLNWYVSEEEFDLRHSRGESFVLGIDTSDGVGRDDISFVLRSVLTGEIVCAAIFNEINLITLADFFVAVLVKYLNVTMIIERKSSAITMIDYMILKLSQAGINPFMRMYNTLVQDMEVRPKDAEEVLRARSSQHEVFTKYKKHIGFNTSGTGVTSRSDLYSTTLIGSLKYTAKVTRDSRLVNQISSLTERNGRIDHASGGNDDLVIGALLSYFVLTKGKNLSYYGIDVRSIMKGNELYLTERYSVNEKGYTKEEMVLKEEKFNELLEIFGSERDPIYSRQLEIQIKKLAEDMSAGGTVLSVEELLEDIKRDKKLKRNY